jgi:hypothetical protein
MGRYHHDYGETINEHHCYDVIERTDVIVIGPGIMGDPTMGVSITDQSGVESIISNPLHVELQTKVQWTMLKVEREKELRTVELNLMIVAKELTTVFLLLVVEYFNS